MTERACYLQTSKSVEYDLRHPKHKISVVMPVHNEQKYLPYSLRSLENIKSELILKGLKDVELEIIFFLDRCSDNSLSLINDFSYWRTNRVIIVSNKSTWENPIAEAFENAFNHATGDIIYTMASDVITDPNIYSVKFFKENDLVSFQYSNQSPDKITLHETYSNLLGRLPFTYKCKYGKWSGHFAMKRKVWETLHFRDVQSPDLDFFNRAFNHGFKHQFHKSKTLHLRSGLKKDKQIQQAKYRYSVKQNPLKVFAHSVLNLKPYLLTHYMKLTLS